MRTLQPLLDTLQHIDDPGTLRAVIGAVLIAIEEHPTITTSQKAHVFDATALCLNALAATIGEPHDPSCQSLHRDDALPCDCTHEEGP